MAIAKNRAEVNKINAEQLAQKLKLEIPFALAIRKWWREIANSFYDKYVETGSVINFEDYKSELETTLKLNYRNINSKFKNQITNDLGVNVTRETLDNIKIETRNFINKTSIFKGALILATAQTLLNNDLNNTIVNLILNNKPIDNTVIAKNTKQTFQARATGKGVGISTTETQMMSESTKQIENDVLINTAEVAAVVRVLNKIWRTVLDERTRIPHARADGQKKKLGESYYVGGEYLKYPGDSNGSIENIANCRCGSITISF